MSSSSSYDTSDLTDLITVIAYVGVSLGIMWLWCWFAKRKTMSKQLKDGNSLACSFNNLWSRDIHIIVKQSKGVQVWTIPHGQNAAFHPASQIVSIECVDAVSKKSLDKVTVDEEDAKQEMKSVNFAFNYAQTGKCYYWQNNVQIRDALKRGIADAQSLNKMLTRAAQDAKVKRKNEIQGAPLSSDSTKALQLPKETAMPLLKEKNGKADCCEFHKKYATRSLDA